MDFKVGEKVRFLHDKSEGVIQRILKQGEVEVLVDDFVEMIVSNKDLVKIDRGERNLRQEVKEEEAKDAPPKTISKLPPELAIVRKDGFFEMWMLNPSDYEIYYTLHLKIRTKIHALNGGLVEPNENSFLRKIDKGEFYDSKTLFIQVLKFRKTDSAEIIPPIHLELPLKFKILKKEPKLIEELNAEGHRFVLESKPESAKMGTDESGGTTLKVEPPSYTEPEEIVDLHIEKLVDDIFGMDSDTMLRIQVEHFEKALQSAVLFKKPRIIFIHGIGTGKLKKEIHRRLDENQFVRNFRLADPVNYGNGATEVEFG